MSLFTYEIIVIRPDAQHEQWRWTVVTTHIPTGDHHNPPPQPLEATVYEDAREEAYTKAHAYIRAVNGLAKETADAAQP